MGGKILEKNFLGKCVKFRHFVNFSYIYFRQRRTEVGAGRTGRYLLGVANRRKLFKNHVKIQICRRLLQLSAPDSASNQSSKFKELDIAIVAVRLCCCSGL